MRNFARGHDSRRLADCHVTLNDLVDDAAGTSTCTMSGARVSPYSVPVHGDREAESRLRARQSCALRKPSATKMHDGKELPAGTEREEAGVPPPPPFQSLAPPPPHPPIGASRAHANAPVLVPRLTSSSNRSQLGCRHALMMLRARCGLRRTSANQHRLIERVLNASRLRIATTVGSDV